MELREYVAVLGRRWWWVASCLLACLVVALAAALLTPRTWTAQTEVFVSSTIENTSPSFLQQRVKSYPDVASSAEVLDPVRDTLGLDMSLAQLRAAVDAENPVDTSQINISVTVDDPQLAADIADAVADEFSSAVERLETTGSGSSPVTLTVTNPAAVPSSPTSPQIPLLLALGLVCGLGSGVAAAVLRDRWDTRIWTPEDVRAAWGGSAPDVLSTGSRREPADRAAQVLARRIERRAQDGTVRVIIVAPTEAGTSSVTDLTADLTDVLGRRGLVVGSPAEDTSGQGDGDGESEGTGRSTGQGAPTAAPSSRPDVVFSTLAPDAALLTWRAQVAESDGVVVVCPPGSADRLDVFELGQLLDGVEAVVVGVVFVHPGRAARGRQDGAADIAPGEAAPQPSSPPRTLLARRPTGGGTGWARLTSPGADFPGRAQPEDDPADVEAPTARPARSAAPRTEAAPRTNRVAGSSRRVSASAQRRAGSPVTVRIPPSQSW